MTDRSRLGELDILPTPAIYLFEKYSMTLVRQDSGVARFTLAFRLSPSIWLRSSSAATFWEVFLHVDLRFTSFPHFRLEISKARQEGLRRLGFKHHHLSFVPGGGKLTCATRRHGERRVADQFNFQS